MGGRLNAACPPACPVLYSPAPIVSSLASISTIGELFREGGMEPGRWGSGAMSSIARSVCRSNRQPVKVLRRPRSGDLCFRRLCLHCDRLASFPRSQTATDCRFDRPIERVSELSTPLTDQLTHPPSSHPHPALASRPSSHLSRLTTPADSRVRPPPAVASFAVSEPPRDP